MKRSKNYKKLYLSILEGLKQGYNPSKISKELGITKQKLNYYISSLKNEGCIEKISYGTWKYIKGFQKRSKKITAVIGTNSGHSLKQDSVRGHGFLFVLELPKNLRNWDKREEILEKLNIKFLPYYVGGVKRGQRLTAQNTNVALTDKSILVNFPESYIRETAILAKKDAIAQFLRVIKHLERILRANFSEFGKYKFKTARQHYALIKNSLARQYLNNEYNSKKLQIYSGRGLWLLIDNSFNLEELETVHKDTAVKDNHKVQDFFNGLDLVEGYTPQFVLKVLAGHNEQIGKNAENLDKYAIHLKSHVESVKQLGESVVELTKIIKEIKGKK